MVKAKVVFDYDAEQDDELTLRIGDIIDNVSEMDGGWWEGDLKGKRGVFPDNFVEKIKDEAPKAHHPPPKPPAPKTAHVSTKRQAKVLFDYDAENEDELTLKAGQIVTVLGEDVEGWWKGEINGSTGVFPNNFVEEIIEGDSPSTEPHPPHPAPLESADEHTEDEDAIKPKKLSKIGFGNIFSGGMPTLRRTSGTTPAQKPPPPQASDHGSKPPPLPPTASKTSEPESSSAPPPRPPSKLPAQDSTPPPNLYKVIADFDVEQEGDLELKVGQFVIVNGTEGDGWFSGECEGKTGMFPDNFVEKASPEEIDDWVKKHRPRAPSHARPPPPSASKGPSRRTTMSDESAPPIPGRKKTKSPPTAPTSTSKPPPIPQHAKPAETPKPAPAKPELPKPPSTNSEAPKHEAKHEPPRPPSHVKPNPPKPEEHKQEPPKPKPAAPIPKKQPAKLPPSKPKPKPVAKPPPKPKVEPKPQDEDDGVPPWKKEMERKRLNSNSKPKPDPAPVKPKASIAETPKPKIAPVVTGTSSGQVPSFNGVSEEDFKQLQEQLKSLSSTVDNLKKHVKLLTEDLDKEVISRLEP